MKVEMCRGATALSPPDTVRAGEILVSVVKTELNKGADEKFIFDQTKRDRKLHLTTTMMTAVTTRTVLARGLNCS